MGERPRIRTGTWRGGTLVTAVLAVIGAAGLATATPATAAGLRASGALAATGTWRVQASPDITTPAGLLASVSCPTARACVGVGDYVNTAGLFVTLAEAWNGTSWRRQPTPNPAGGGNLLFTGVSCPSASLCEAVGSYIVNSGAARVGLAEQWNGRTWSVQPLLAPGGGSKDVEPAAVACATARFCEAVGRYENSSGAYFPLAEVWSGASWRPQTIAGAAGFQLNGVTCRSATSCEAVGDGSPSGQNAEIWNGQSWSLQSTPVPPHAVGMALAAVSCVAANMCEAVGDWLAPGGELPRALTLAEQWNGTSWSMRSTPRPPSATFMALNSVSCTAAAACEATGTLQQAGEEALAEAWNGRSWTIQPGAAPAGATSNFLSGVSCVTPRRCEAVGEGLDPSARYIGLAEVWNGTWKIQRTPEPAKPSNVRSFLNGVSCVTAAFCVAVGQSNSIPGLLTEVWNGTSWRIRTAPGQGALASVSCPSAGFCAAVGATIPAGGSPGAEIDLWNGRTWSAVPPAPGFTSLTGVSCASASFCEAVGSGSSGPGAQVWNGRLWVVQSTPLPAGANAQNVNFNGVSCSAPNACETVGGYITGTSQTATLAEAWDGTGWSIQPTPSPMPANGPSLKAVWCTSPASCTAVGVIGAFGAGLTLAEAWDGRSWRAQSTPSPRRASGGAALSGVWCGTSLACTAVGFASDPGGTPATLVEGRS